MTINAHNEFAQHFPNLKGQFTLKPFQEKVIENLCNNDSTVAIMPTGGGKSLIYWVATKAMKSTTLVISPLIALIDEQADKLQQQGCSVLVAHSGIDFTEQIKQLTDFANSKSTPEFIFASPERIATDGFFEYCLTARKNSIKLVTIDEIHCISQWGFDFRPFYKRIPDFLNKVFGSKHPKILGLTATINPKELHDVLTDFNIDRKNVLKADVLLRFDVDLKVEKYVKEEEKEERLWQLLEENRGEKILVYLYRKYHKRGVEDLCETAVQRGFSAVSFHGDMTGGDRQEVLKDFREGKSTIVFATNAFGMGIDIPDIRNVIHFMIPESVEQYYQEIGRAGRDEKGATAYILYSNKNVQVRRTHFIDKSFPKSDEIAVRFQKTANNEVGKKTLQYFQDEEIQETLPYFLNCGAIQILGKGFTNLKAFGKINNKEIADIIDISMPTGMVIPVLYEPQFKKLPSQKFFDKFYHAFLREELKLQRQLDKCLIIEAEETELSEKQLLVIEAEISEKRQYKHDLLDYLSYLLDNYEDSKKFHQEIGRYLGVPKHLLGKIHKTESGIWVRSKSEVIIANILFRSKIHFEYEHKLFYNKTQWKEPDFTITHNGKTWYWEHLGMLGEEQYDTYWAEKKAIYESLKIKNLITTKESSVLSAIANEKIKMIFASN